MQPANLFHEQAENVLAFLRFDDRPGTFPDALDIDAGCLHPLDILLQNILISLFRIQGRTMMQLF